MVNGVPTPTSVPVPQVPLYHFKVPPEPPVAVKVIEPPSFEQIAVLSALAKVGSVGAGVTLIITLTHAEGVQFVASHLAKYVVVVVGAAIVNGVPVPTSVPVPHVPLYHFKVPPEPPVAVNTIEPPSFEQIAVLSALAEVGFVGAGVTLIITLTQVEGVQFVASHLAK
jgi:uncharacterized membrane protein